MRLQITPKFSSVLLAISYLTSVLAKTVYVPSQGRFCAGNYVWCPPKVSNHMNTELISLRHTLATGHVVARPHNKWQRGFMHVKALA